MRIERWIWGSEGFYESSQRLDYHGSRVTLKKLVGDGVLQSGVWQGKARLVVLISP